MWLEMTCLPKLHMASTQSTEISVSEPLYPPFCNGSIPVSHSHCVLPSPFPPQFTSFLLTIDHENPIVTVYLIRVLIMEHMFLN
jgi:hypothetical protein